MTSLNSNGDEEQKYCADFFTSNVIIPNDMKRKNQIIDRLLELESKFDEPPKWLYNHLRNLFHVPFQTETYKEWWAKGPECTDPIDDPHMEYFENKIKDDQTWAIARYEWKDWLTDYLLTLESEGKDPPYTAFERHRNHFDIPFTTDKFKSWWEAPNQFTAKGYKWVPTLEQYLKHAEDRKAMYDKHNAVKESN